MIARSNWLMLFAATFALPAPLAAQYGVDSSDFVSAIEKNDSGKAQELLSAHPRLINARNAKGDTALIAAISRQSRSWSGYLISLGADIEQPGQRGDTPLIAAARVGFREAAEWLLAKRAKVNATNKMGETALIIAVQNRDSSMSKLLLSVGADPDITDSAAGYSARDYAKRDARSRDILKLIEGTKKS